MPERRPDAPTMMKRFSRRTAALFVSTTLIPLVGLSQAAHAAGTVISSWAPPPDISQDGHRVTFLFWYTTILCIVAFALVTFALVYFSFRYRARPGHRAVYDHGTSRKDFWGTMILATLVFVLIDMNLVWQSQKNIDEYLYNYPTGKDTVRIQVMAQQWAWNFRYPGADGKFNTPDDVLTFNEMRIPADRPVMLNLRAKDVIHSFYVPNFRVKHDANPGYTTRMWFQAKSTGDFEIACSQMCGWAHYKMRGDLKVTSPAEFDRWYREAQGDAQRRFDPADAEGQWGWEWQQ